ncbi:MAG: aminotransferase class V-fold PLP-dependent enzyme [Candidatus Gracilibacteria bacterium]|nr:aminotransferase class V-fold PLP-dependent enzyme [Candidatus Gracilibacteria bacterium]
MTDLKKDFPIFSNNPDLIFFDSTATSQKPAMVIDGIHDFLSHNYSNIHRGMYDIAQTSEGLYKKSKEIVAEVLHAKSYKEVIYTYNSTYAINLLTQTLKKNKKLQKGDTVLLSLMEHHANVVPWLILKEEIGIKVEYVGVDENFNLDMQDFSEKYNETVKVISFTHVSNVTGQVFDLAKIGKLKRDDTLFVVDASQSIPHMSVDVQELNCDFLFFTGHKVFADSGIGVLWGKQELYEEMECSFSGGGAISDVELDSFKSCALPDKYEPGTPNITGAVSLLKAFEYIESIGGYEKIEQIEAELVEYFLVKAKKYPQLHMVGSVESQNRVSVFGFILEGHHSHDVAEVLAENNIAVRSGKHCAHPLFKTYGHAHSVRASLYIYNSPEEIDRFFEVIEGILE